MVREANKTDTLYAAAVEFVSERRKSIGLRATGRLSKGYRSDPMLCPIAKALEACAVREAWCDVDSGIVVLEGHTSGGVPAKRYYDAPLVAEFMSAFDAGEYPTLVTPKTPIKVKKPGERKATVIG